jgi:hypothetical protein
MNRRAFLLSTVLLAFAGRVHAQARLKLPEQWYGVEVEDNVFIVQMPGVPDHRIVSDVDARGTPFQLHSYSLEAALDARARSLDGGKWTKVDWRQVQGASAVESIGPVRGGNALRQLVLLKRRHFVSLAFLGNAAVVNGPDAERFFNSLQLQS